MSEVVRYVCDLAKKNSEALSFIPTPRLEEYERRGQILVARENDDLCGFVVHGAGWPVLRVYQACIQYDARRRDHGFGLVERLRQKATDRALDNIELWCADDLDANSFWEAAGFRKIAQRRGGARRGRMHNLWVMEITPLPLLALISTNGPDGR